MFGLAFSCAFGSFSESLVEMDYSGSGSTRCLLFPRNWLVTCLVKTEGGANSKCL